jgi:hypothetical protein
MISGSVVPSTSVTAGLKLTPSGCVGPDADTLGYFKVERDMRIGGALELIHSNPTSQREDRICA